MPKPNSHWRAGVLTLAGAVSFLFGCASTTQSGRDLMCPAIAAYANASTDSVIHVVELTNDWGCDFHKQDIENELALA